MLPLHRCMGKGRLCISENHAKVSKIYLGMHNSFKLSHIKKVHLLVQVFLCVCMCLCKPQRERETRRKQEAEESRQYKAPLVGAQVTRLQPSTNTQQLEEED